MFVLLLIPLFSWDNNFLTGILVRNQAGASGWVPQQDWRRRYCDVKTFPSLHRCNSSRLIKDYMREQGSWVQWCDLLSFSWPYVSLKPSQVLLYNFFEDSKVDISQWRVILNDLQASTEMSVPAPKLDETRHASICNEVSVQLVVTFGTILITISWKISMSQSQELVRICGLWIVRIKENRWGLVFATFKRYLINLIPRLSGPVGIK